MSRGLALVLILATAPASADPRNPQAAPRMPRLADVAALTFVAKEGGPSRRLCPAFAQRLVIDLARNRWSQDLCLDEGGESDKPRKSRTTGALTRAMRDELATTYGKLSSEMSDGCAKDAGDRTLTVTRRKAAAIRLWSASSACPPRMKPTLPELDEVFSHLSALVSSEDG